MPPTECAEQVRQPAFNIAIRASSLNEATREKAGCSRSVRETSGSAEIAQELRARAQTGDQQPVARSGAHDVEQLALRRVNIIQFDFIGDGLDALLERQKVFVAGHDGNSSELQPFGQVHDTEPHGANWALLARRDFGGLWTRLLDSRSGPRQRIAQRLLASKFGQELAHVVGDINVFGEPLDDVVALRERRAALEDNMLAKGRREQRVDGPNDPNILFKQMDGPPRVRCGHAQSIKLVGAGKTHKGISHGPPAFRHGSLPVTLSV